MFARWNLIKNLINQLRIHQWVKNILVIIPMLAKHEVYNLNLWQNVFCAFLSFCFVSSFVYTINDIFDIPHDRKHPTKSARPLASGKISLKNGLLLSAAMLMAGLSVARTLGEGFLSVILFYVFVNFLYSFKLKEVMVLDVFVLAGFYTLRLFAGSLATDIVISHWLLSFSTFFFLGLAMSKRYIELKNTTTHSQEPLQGRGYTKGDSFVIISIGITASFLAILILALYFSSSEVAQIYVYPSRLWIVAPILSYWVCRFWMLVHRGKVDDDPVVFAVKDPVSWFVLVMTLGFVFYSA